MVKNEITDPFLVVRCVFNEIQDQKFSMLTPLTLLELCQMGQTSIYQMSLGNNSRLKGFVSQIYLSFVDSRD